MKRKLAVILAVLAAALIATGGVFAYASIPDSSGIIHGCYVTSGARQGQLSVIDTDAGQSCPSGTVPLNWPSGASVVTRDVHYAYPGNPSSIDDIQTVTCTSGHPVDGGIIQTTADSGWLAGMASPTAVGNPGGAVTTAVREVSSGVSETSSNADPVDPSLPRPVGTGWKMHISGSYAGYSDPNQGINASFGITVTLYADCV